METSPAIERSRLKPLGRNCFVAGCLALLLFSAVHLIPFVRSIVAAPTDPLEAEALRSMAAVKVDMGPFHTDFSKLQKLLSASYSVLLFFVVALNLVALPSVLACGKLKGLALVNAIFAAVLLAISLIYQFPPPGVFSLIALLFFAAAVVRVR